MKGEEIGKCVRIGERQVKEQRAKLSRKGIENYRGKGIDISSIH
jgi:hypothetical protein